MIFDLVKDLADMLDAMPNEHPRRRMIELLDEAIRRDVHFIDRHPTALFQCMWNTCWWYDAPQAEQHYEAAEDEAEMPWKSRRAKLSALLADWRHQRQLSIPEARWVRALRPPSLPLGGAQTAIMVGHRGAVRGVAYTPNGEHVISAGQDGIRGWESETGREEPAFRLYDNSTSSISVLSATRQLVAIGEDGTGYVWDCESSAQVHVPRFPNNIQFMEASPQGEVLCLVLKDNRIQVWRPSEWEMVCTIDTFAKRISALAVAADGAWVVAHCDGALHAWQASDGSRKDFPAIAVSNANTLAISPNNTSLVIGGQDMQVWDLQPVKQRLTVPAKQTGPRRLLFDRESSPFERLVFSSDGRYLLAARGALDRAVSIFSTSSGAATRVFAGHTDRVRDVAWSPDGQSIASSSDDGTVRLWSVGKGEPRRVLRGFGPSGGQGELMGSIVQLMISPDCRHALTGSYDHSSRLWNVSNGELEEVVFTRAHFDRIVNPWKHIVRKTSADETSGRLESRWKVTLKQGELVFEDTQTSCTIGWFSEPVTRCVTHPIGFLAGAIENHFYLLAVEGDGFCFHDQIQAEQERVDRLVSAYDKLNPEESSAVDLQDAHQFVAEAMQTYRDVRNGKEIELFGVSTKLLGERHMRLLAFKHVLNLLERAEITFSRLSQDTALAESSRLRSEVQSLYHALEEQLLLGSENHSPRAEEISQYAIADGAMTEAIEFEDRQQWQAALDAYKRAERVYREINDAESLDKCLNFQAAVLSAMYRSAD